jgi:putative transposase
MRREQFSTGEYYHIYNRGTEKRNIFLEDSDFSRFLTCMTEFNCEKPIGSLYEKYLKQKKNGGSASILEAEPPQVVKFICYSLLPNHYHFILKQICEGGIQKFMQKIGTAYTMYFNKKYKRSGILFQGKFKASHIKSTPRLLQLSVYVNCNSEIHGIEKADIYKWNSYNSFINREINSFCNNSVVLDNFSEFNSYKNYAIVNVREMIQKKQDEKEVLE